MLKKLLGLFKFAKDRCCHCRLCLRICPTKNLVLDPKHHILKRGKNCIFCFRCYNFCTTLAVNYGKNVDKPEKYKRYKGPDEDMKIMDIMK